MEHELICPVCGKKFTSKAGNAKYCSDRCRVTGYKHAAKAKTELLDAADDQKESLKRKQAEHKRELKLQKQREAAAADGDAFSKLVLSRPFGYEYWLAYQQMEQEFASASGIKSRRRVNGISVNDIDFPLKVTITIQEMGIIQSDMEG